MGDARSRRGGTLLMTLLKGADGQIYGMAQGNVLIGRGGTTVEGAVANSLGLPAPR
jgi:flagellar P-ring protein precursor FlgI